MHQSANVVSLSSCSPYKLLGSCQLIIQPSALPVRKRLDTPPDSCTHDGAASFQCTRPAMQQSAACNKKLLSPGMIIAASCLPKRSVLDKQRKPILPTENIGQQWGTGDGYRPQVPTTDQTPGVKMALLPRQYVVTWWSARSPIHKIDTDSQQADKLTKPLAGVPSIRTGW